jgi:hypothetical protein
MMRTAVSGVLIGLVFASLAGWAQTSKDGVIKLNGGRTAVLGAAQVQPFTPAVEPSSKLVKIYSNLGKGEHVYSTLAGYGILGPDAGQPWPQMVGTGFRPKADYLVTLVQVGATYFQGTNALVVSLNQDNHNAPGKVLHTWHFKDLPEAWSCCILQTGKYAKGIPVEKGKLYWVVVRPETKFTDTYDIFPDNYAEKEGHHFSNNIGSGWDTSYQVLGAVGVFGK